MDYERVLATIVEHTDRIADPGERLRERQRLTRELYKQQAAAVPPRSEADEDAAEVQALASLMDSGIELARALER